MPESAPADDPLGQPQPAPAVDAELMARTSELAEAGQREFDVRDYDGADLQLGFLTADGVTIPERIYDSCERAADPLASCGPG